MRGVLEPGVDTILSSGLRPRVDTRRSPSTEAGLCIRTAVCWRQAGISHVAPRIPKNLTVLGIGRRHKTGSNEAHGRWEEKDDNTLAVVGYRV